MFKKLFIRLTITNALILITFMLIFSFSLIGLLSLGMNYSAEKTLDSYLTRLKRSPEILTIYDYNIKDNSFFRRNIHNKINIDYFVWHENLTLKTSEINDYIILAAYDDMYAAAYEHAKEVMFNKDEKSLSIVKINGHQYRLYSSYYQKQNGEYAVAQVYQSKELENDMLSQIFTILIAIGSASVFILIIISSYLAKKSLEPVKIAYESQKEFIADASHELRTPLTVMQTNLDVLTLKENESISNNMKWFNNVYSETETMGKLIEDLLTLAQADNNQIDMDFHEVNLSIIIKDTCDKLKLLAKKKEILFEEIISDNVLIKADEQRIRQLIIILIDNAIKYTSKGDKICVSLMTTSVKAIIKVSDTGIGIKDEDKARIFDRFYRVDKARSKDEGGVGLGLSIALWIIKEHKGKINLQSKIGEGSTFIVEIPKKP